MRGQKHIGLIEVLGFGLFVFAFSYVVVGGPDPRFIVVYLLILCALEVLAQFRWRLAVVCPECGFDPILYKKDTARACERVKWHLDRRQMQKFGLLAPKLQLPAAPPKPRRKEPQLLSKRI